MHEHARWHRQRIQLSIVGACLLLLLAFVVANANANAHAATAHCQQVGPQTVPTNAWSRAHARLAPSGATSILLCRYAGLNSRPRFKLFASATVDYPVAVNALAREFNALPKIKPGIYSCPAAFGSQIKAVFTYPQARKVTILVETSGCSSATNGDIVRAIGALGGRVGQQLLTQLEALTSVN